MNYRCINELGFVLVATVFVAACSFRHVPTTERECVAQGGTWRIHPRRDIGYCLLPRTTPTARYVPPQPTTTPIALRNPPVVQPVVQPRQTATASEPTPRPTPKQSRGDDAVHFVLVAPHAGRSAILYVTDGTDILLFGDRPGEPLRIWAPISSVRCDQRHEVDPHGMIDLKQDRLYLVLPDCSVVRTRERIFK